MSSINDTNPMRSIIGRCVVMGLADYCKKRRTEFPEDDVFVVESKYQEVEGEIRKIGSGLRQFQLSNEVQEDEVFYFQSDIQPRKVGSHCLNSIPLSFTPFLSPSLPPPSPSLPLLLYPPPSLPPPSFSSHPSPLPPLRFPLPNSSPTFPRLSPYPPVQLSTANRPPSPLARPLRSQRPPPPASCCLVVVHNPPPLWHHHRPLWPVWSASIPSCCKLSWPLRLKSIPLNLSSFHYNNPQPSILERGLA